MDWQSGLAGDAGLYEHHVIPAADFLVANGPSDGVERWEEQSGYSPSTIAAEIAGLTAASRIATINGDRPRARVYQATADQFARKIKDWTVTTTGPYSGPGISSGVSKTGDPDAAISYGLGNGSITADQRSIVDAGFLELVRLGVLRASDPEVQRLARGRRPRHQARHAERPRVLPIRDRCGRVRGRIRRLLRARRHQLLAHRRAMAADRHRVRPPVARPVGRAG